MKTRAQLNKIGAHHCLQQFIHTQTHKIKEKVREEDKDAGRESDGYHLDIVHLTCDSHIYAY